MQRCASCPVRSCLAKKHWIACPDAEWQQQAGATLSSVDQGTLVLTAEFGHDCHKLGVQIEIMEQQNSEALPALTPSKITAWLDCPHYLNLKHQRNPQGSRGGSTFEVGTFARLLLDKGLSHEAAVEAAYVDAGLNVHRVADKAPGQPFADWARDVADTLQLDVDVVFQMPLLHNGIRGVADFLERRIDPETGDSVWSPVDAKLARNEAKPGHVLQLCFYAEALADATGSAPETLAVALGSGRIDTVGYEDVRPYWERLRSQLATAMDIGPDGDTHPEPCDHCTFCEFENTCEAVWRDEDSLVYVAGIRRTDRDALEAVGIHTLAELSERTESVDGLRPERLATIQTQARLQVEARESPDQLPPFEVFGVSDEAAHGLETLPKPDDGDIFLDFEGHPFWRADSDLFFLFGWVARDASGNWEFNALWAHDKVEEADRVRELVEYIRDRRAAHPGMHVYHYNHTERSSLESMASGHPVVERALRKLIGDQVFVDLMQVVRDSLQAGVESYSLKHLEVLAGYERGHEIDKGAGAVVAYEQWMSDGDDALLAAIADYNDDDVRATKALRDWLITLRPNDMEWPTIEVSESDEEDEFAELIARLDAQPADSAGPVLAGLLGYWSREGSAHYAPIIASLEGDVGDRLDNDATIAGLFDHEQFERVGKSGRPLKWPGLRMRFPDQAIGRGLLAAELKKLVFLDGDGRLGYLKPEGVDRDENIVEVEWKEAASEIATFPEAVAEDTWVAPGTKKDALLDLARRLDDPETHGEPNPVTVQLLTRAAPRFSSEQPSAFTDDVDELAQLVCDLHQSVLGVQGPPGAGKTYRGAHMVKALIKAGKRVGIMAMSHAAIDNFLSETATVCEADPEADLRALRLRTAPETGPLNGVTYTSNNSEMADPDYNVVTGTAWTFTSKHAAETPVDVLLVDEAGQLALIDAVVASTNADSVVLLGDPQQLPHVAVASHPYPGASSSLGHLLGDNITIPPHLGVFIEQTWRMHPDICQFISDRIYEGRLTSHPHCADRTTDAGTGLRWIQATHEGRSTEAPEEADLIAHQIRQLLKQSWTDKDHTTRPLTPADVLVVAPYNDQVALLKKTFSDDPELRGMRAGTVDRFQGQQAPIVFFSMTSSSADDMPRGIDFLFSQNRFNVAISRAQCLAFLVCTEPLLDARAKTIHDMVLVANICAFVEAAIPVAPLATNGTSS